ncbi:MAG TPA: phosphoglucosamine mutase [Candidatus Kapabacteria bacterium]|nr:phosphoglucosamine mutase [Candidatus Kapabacteria bacterium]HPP39983.1 phosphoglucosamine mutase [Candidatus Kapabacteria bacterium]
MPVVRSISGLRATTDDGSLNTRLISSYVKAFAKLLNFGRIVVGRDGRQGSDEIEKLVLSELSSVGCEVVSLGVVPTPTVQLYSELPEFSGGIAITASHNPQNWNGLKFINSNGVFLDAYENQQLWDIVDNNEIVTNHHSGNINTVNNAIDYHIDKILDIVKSKIDDIRKRKFRIAVDAVNASGSVAIPELLKRFDCETLELFCDTSGVFPHEPEPLPKNLSQLAEFVKINKCDMGVAVDPDADRLVLVDNNGECINEELTIALAIDAVLRNSKEKDNTVVVNLSSSNISQWICNQYGAKLFRSPVGEINVVKKMKEVAAAIGGEGSGGVIFPQCHYGRDSLVGLALVLSAITDKNQNISEIVASLPTFFMKKEKFAFEGDFVFLKNRFKQTFSQGTFDEQDGLRIDFPDSSWLQIRKSNTEPIIRIIAEAQNNSRTIELIEAAKKLLP